MAQHQFKQTEGGIVEPAEDQADHHAGQHKRREEQRLDQADAAYSLVQVERHRQPQGRRQQKQQQPQQIVLERGIEGRRVEQLDIIAQPDKHLVAHAIPVVKAQPDTVDDGIDHVDTDHQARRRQKQQRRDTLLPRPRRSGTPAR
jgi:hypothetical protein